MKQIFDWMREQFGKIIGEVHSPADTVWNNAVKMCIEKVNEAEAKWEADCCEWKVEKIPTKKGAIELLRDPHNQYAHWNDTGEWVYCNCCGKPIKISEVEQMTFTVFCVGFVICLGLFIVTGLIGWFMSVSSDGDGIAIGGWIFSTFGFAICLTILLYQNGIIKQEVE